VLKYEWSRTPDISLPAPDLTLFLDIALEKAAAERSGMGKSSMRSLICRFTFGSV
jgi:dTMP kinase